MARMQNNNFGAWYKAYNIFPARVADLKWTGSTNENRVASMAQQFYSLSAVKNQYKTANSGVFPGINKCVCLAQTIVFKESSWVPTKINNYTEGGVVHYVYGLWQISDIHSAMAQWPTRVGLAFNTIYNPEYNTRLAFTIMNSAINEPSIPWLDWSVYNSAKTECNVS